MGKEERKIGLGLQCVYLALSGNCDYCGIESEFSLYLHKVSYSMKIKTLCFILSFSFFLDKAKIHGPVTTIAKDLLIAGINFDVVKNRTKKGAYDSKFL